MNWQPISTAPKDGTAILIFDPSRASFNEYDGKRFDDPRFAIGYWRTWYDDGEWMWGDRNHAFVSPTHWMPLPPAPSGESEVSG